MGITMWQKVNRVQFLRNAILFFSIMTFVGFLMAWYPSQYYIEPPPNGWRLLWTSIGDVLESPSFANVLNFVPLFLMFILAIISACIKFISLNERTIQRSIQAILFGTSTVIIFLCLSFLPVSHATLWLSPISRIPHAIGYYCSVLGTIGLWGCSLYLYRRKNVTAQGPSECP